MERRDSRGIIIGLREGVVVNGGIKQSQILSVKIILTVTIIIITITNREWIKGTGVMVAEALDTISKIYLSTLLVIYKSCRHII